MKGTTGTVDIKLGFVIDWFEGYGTGNEPDPEESDQIVFSAKKIDHIIALLKEIKQQIADNGDSLSRQT